MSNQSTIDQLVNILEATLLPESVKKAQDELLQLSIVPGFARALLQIVCNTGYPNHIRNSASVALKNFVRNNWAGDGEAPLADDEREELRNSLLEVMFMVPSFLQSLMTEIVCKISLVDFPDKWPRLIQILTESLKTATNFDQLVVTLGTLEQLVHRYRHEMRSNKLWSEILFVVQNIAEPLTQLYSRMLQYVPDQSTQQLNISERQSWFQIVLELTRIYHSLISQDLPEYFEDNLTPWMEGFLQMLQLKLPEPEGRFVDTEPNEHDRLRTEICEIATLFSQRFEEPFMPYMQRFMEAIWNLLVITDNRIRFDPLVNAALNFLAAICQRPHYADYFRVEGVLKAICENVIVKNLMLRAEDLEIYESEPFEFLKRDIEGSDLETRRRGAAEFVRALCKQFEAEICGILSNTIQDFLTQYQQNPLRNYVMKDVVYFLVSALASKGTTIRHGTKDASQLIDIISFYQQNVRSDLLFGSANELPILRGDALKYLVLFRNQLNAEQIIECFRGESGLPENSIIRFLSSNFFLLHHYLAYSMERLLLLKEPNSQLPLITAKNFELRTCIDRFFACFQMPQAYETHYIMKALMRLFSIIDEDITRTHAHIYINKLSQMIAEVIRTPKNPLIVHYIFESLCILIKKTYSKIEGGLEKHVIPVVDMIIQNDVAEFTPYAFQLIALLLDQSQAGLEQGVAVNRQAYVVFFQSLLKPDYWARGANIPALILVFESFIRCLPLLPFGAQYSDQVLAIFQRLIGSKAYDQHGFRLANAFIPYLDNYEGIATTSKSIFLTMLNRMHQMKTSRYSKQFTLFLFRYASIKGGMALANTLESIQSGIYNMIVEKIVLAEMQAMPQTTTFEEKRVIAIGSAKLITETVGFLGRNYPSMVEAVVNILEAFDHTPHCPGADATSRALLNNNNEDGEINEAEYSDPYCKLTYAQHPEPFAPEVTNIKRHFAQAVFIVDQNTNPGSLECMNARVISCLRAYLISS